MCCEDNEALSDVSADSFWAASGHCGGMCRIVKSEGRSGSGQKIVASGLLEAS